MSNKKKVVALAISAMIGLQSCATGPLKETFNSDDPCNNNKRNLATLIGAVAGAVIANKVSKDKNKTANTVLGGLAGGALGRLVGSELDKRACEIHKLAQQNGLEIETTRIKTTTAKSSSSSNTATTKPVDVGYSVAVVDQKDKPQFLSGSAQLQPHAKEHFRQIAKHYTVAHVLADANTQKPEEVAALKKTMQSKRILLIGHTDDTGNSQLNARLSERRAHAVAQIFKQAGVLGSQLYYQGAGETLPIADNVTAAGRAKNRRVEIVDLSDQVAFDLYLKNRRPNTEYYRPIEDKKKPAKTVVAKTSESETSTNTNKQETKSSTKQKPQIQTVNKPTTTAATDKKNASSFIDFGGTPLGANTRVASIGSIVTKNSGFNIISEAKADDISKIATCDLDRPRNVGAVKSLHTGKEYRTTDYLTGLNRSSWFGRVNGHLIGLTRVGVLRNGGVPANKPNLLIYIDHKNKSSKPNFKSEPDVNTYYGSEALLYRVFTDGPVKCMDVVIPHANPRSAKDSLIVYENKGVLFARSFNPRIAK